MDILSRTLKNCIRRKNQCINYSYISSYISSDAEHKYKRYKNKLILILRFEEKKYYNDQIRLKTKDIKGTWSILNKVVNNKNKVNHHQPVSLEINGFNITDTQLICNEFNNLFVNIGPELAQNIKQGNLPSVSSFLHDRNTF